MLKCKRKWFRIAGIVSYVLVGVCFQHSSAQVWNQKHESKLYNSTNSPIQEPICTMQDKDGFLWVGTVEGLKRFDGRNFRSFKKDNGIGNAPITTILYQADSGRLIVATGSNGVYYFDGVHEAVPVTNDSLIYKLWIAGIFVYKDIIYLNTPGEVYQIRNGKLGKANIPVPEGTASAIYRDQEHQYVWGIHGLYTTDLKTKASQILTAETMRVVSGKWKGKKQYWVSASDGVYMLNGNTCTQTIKFPTAKRYRPDMCTDQYGNVYTVADKIYKIDTSGTVSSVVPKEFSQPNITFNGIYVDSFQNIWVSSSTGLFKVFLQPIYESLLHKVPYHSNTFMYNPQESTVLYYDKVQFSVLSQGADGKVKEIHKLPEKSKQKFPDVHSFWYDIKKREGCFSTNYGVFRLEDQALRDIYYPYWIPFEATLKSKSNRLYASGMFGLQELDNDTLKDLPINEVSSKAIVHHITEDKYGNIWASALNGLYYFDEKKVRNVSPANGLLSSNISYVFARNDTVFLNQDDMGLYLFRSSPEGKLSLINHLTTENGLFSNTASNFYVGNNGIIYLLHKNKGVSVIQLATDGSVKCKVVSEELFPSLDYNSMFGAYIDGDNNLVLLFEHKANKINVKELFKPGNRFPNIKLTDIRLQTRSVKWQERGFDLLFDNVPVNMSLAYRDNFLTFYYNGIYLGTNDKLRYQYRLAPGSDVWIDAGETPATYNNLSPGNYVFMVRAALQNSESWSPPVEYQFIITPPWWQTWWFRLLAVVVFISAGVIIAWMRIRAFKRTEQLKRVALENEMKALRSQINPHFVQNTFQIISNRISQYNPLEIIPFLKKTSDYFRAVLLKSEVNSCTLEEEIDFTEKYLRFQKEIYSGLEYTIEVAEEVDTIGIVLPSMLLQPFIENSIKYGFSGSDHSSKVVLTFSADEHYLKIEIKDNGKGADMETLKIKQTSRGNMITRQRLHLFYQKKKHPYKLSFSSKPGEGYQVEFMLPL